MLADSVIVYVRIIWYVSFKVVEKSGRVSDHECIQSYNVTLSWYLKTNYFM